MYYEPDTVWGRTVQGDEEIAVPRNGLSIVQRRMLQQLAQPRTFATLVAKNHADAPKLEHELIRLAQLQLVAFQRPGSPQPRTAPGIELPLAQPPRGHAPAWKPPLVVYVAAVAFGIGFTLLVLL